MGSGGQTPTAALSLPTARDVRCSYTILPPDEIDLAGPFWPGFVFVHRRFFSTSFVRQG
jgi:hypothetical protein